MDILHISFELKIEIVRKKLPTNVLYVCCLSGKRFLLKHNAQGCFKQTVTDDVKSEKNCWIMPFHFVTAHQTGGMMPLVYTISTVFSP